MNLQKQYAVDNGAGPSTLRSPTPIEDVGITLGSARELSIRIQALADRALGPVPESACGSQTMPTSGGVLGGMRDDALVTRELVEDGMRALARLEQVLA